MDVRNEPSMEDILASIKRIIADDGNAVLATARGRKGSAGASPAKSSRGNGTGPESAAGSAPSAADEPPVQEAPVQEAEVLELTQAMPQPDAALSDIRTHEEEAEIREVDENREADPAPSTRAPSAAVAADPVIVSSDAASASRQALDALSAMIVKQPAGDNSLEGLVREMLRPMLKEWLDAKLPELVEAMVAREIARITGRAA